MSTNDKPSASAMHAHPGAKAQSGGMSGLEKTPANAAAQGDQPKAFDEHGAIGKQFTGKGALGGTAQAVGGPFDKNGAIGKQFTADGAIGGMVQDMMGGTKGGEKNRSN